jgi:hypothetical protein
MIPDWIIGDYCQGFWDEEEFNSNKYICQSQITCHFLYNMLNSLDTDKREPKENNYTKQLLILCYCIIENKNGLSLLHFKDKLLYFYINYLHIDGVKETCFKIDELMDTKTDFSKKCLTYSKKHTIKYILKEITNAKVIFNDKTIDILKILYCKSFNITQDYLIEAENEIKFKNNKKDSKNIVLNKIAQVNSVKNMFNTYNEREGTHFIPEYRDDFDIKENEVKFTKHNSLYGESYELLDPELVYKVKMREIINNKADDESFIANLAPQTKNDCIPCFRFCILGDNNNIIEYLNPNFMRSLYFEYNSLTYIQSHPALETCETYIITEIIDYFKMD